MKRLSIEKLNEILLDLKENGMAFIDDNQMERLYQIYGDNVYSFSGMEVSTKGKEYIKLKDRQPINTESDLKK